MIRHEWPEDRLFQGCGGRGEMSGLCGLFARDNAREIGRQEGVAAAGGVRHRPILSGRP